MSITRLITFAMGIIFIIILYVIIYYALKIMYKDVKTGGKRRGSTSIRKYGLEIVEAGVNGELEEGSVMLIRGDVTIGRRDTNDIMLSEPFVSGNHAKVYMKNTNLFIEDLKSTNGVYVNDEKIEGIAKLVPNDIIKIGSAVFRVLRSDKL